MFRPLDQLSRQVVSPPHRLDVGGVLAGRPSSLHLHGGAPRRNLPPPLTPRSSADNKPAEYVGSTTCQGCHEDIFNAFQKNPHQVVETDKKRGFETKACESCHGPGQQARRIDDRRRYHPTCQAQARAKPTSSASPAI